METRTGGQWEDRVSSTVEAQTSKLPSVGFLSGALGAIAASAILKGLGKDEWALFVGQWAPVILIFGLYNKMVKQLGSDRYTRAA